MEDPSLGVKGIMITLKNLKESTIPGAVGYAACNPDFLRLANEAQTRLAAEGRWWGTTKRIRVCVNEKCITWPAGVATVEGFNIFGSGVPLRNGWFEFQDNVRTVEISKCSCSAQQLLDRGFSPQYRDALVSSYIRIYPVSSADDGAVVLLQGLDQNQQPIRGNTGTDYYDGEKLTLASPMATSTHLFYPPGLTGVQKPITKSYLKVFSVDPLTLVETQIATWGPSDTAPLFRRSLLVQLPKCCNATDEGNGCDPGLKNCQGAVADAIVRLEPHQLLVDTDWLLVQNLAAMKLAMKSMKSEDKNEYTQAANEYQMAVRLLKVELAKYDPPERIQINSDFGIMSRNVGDGIF